MTIQRYSISAFPTAHRMGIDIYDNKDDKGKYCLYADVAEKINNQEESAKSLEKLQIALELSQRRELILMDLLDERYKNANLR